MKYELGGHNTSRIREKKPIYPKINNTLCVEKTNVADVWFWRNGKKDVVGGSRVEWEGRKKKEGNYKIYILYPVRFVTKQENKQKKRRKFVSSEGTKKEDREMERNEKC